LSRLTKAKPDPKPVLNEELTFMPFKAMSFLRSTYKEKKGLFKN